MLTLSASTKHLPQPRSTKKTNKRRQKEQKQQPVMRKRKWKFKKRPGIREQFIINGLETALDLLGRHVCLHRKTPSHTGVMGPVSNEMRYLFLTAAWNSALKSRFFCACLVLSCSLLLRTQKVFRKV